MDISHLFEIAMPEEPVLIVGAGPVGLLLAYLLHRQKGAAVPMIDPAQRPSDR
jgi:2-polyprenyl-6-methoxyphenol hydroxylase-like FAD-dependent oxidoreductase